VFVRPEPCSDAFVCRHRLEDDRGTRGDSADERQAPPLRPRPTWASRSRDHSSASRWREAVTR
jgi:hypothetical protein